MPSAWTMPLTASANDLGEVLTATSPGVAQFQPLFQRRVLVAIGARQVSDTQIWLVAWQFDTAALTTIATAGFLTPPISGRLRRMRVLHSTPVVSTDNITYTVVLNQITSTSLAVTLNTGAASGSNLSDIVEVGASDLISLKGEGATTTRLIRTAITFDFEF